MVEIIAMHMILGNLTMKQGVTIMYWLAQAGIAEAKKWGLNPNNEGGNYAKKFKTAIGHDVAHGDLYDCDMLGYESLTLSRTIMTVPILPAHEQIAENIASDPTCRERLRDLRKSRALPPVYYSHPIVIEAGDEPVLPLGLFIDGSNYSHVGSVLGFWLINMVTGVR